MIKNKCLVCGSLNLKADRALSGRLICTSCGNPYGVRKFNHKRMRNYNLSLINRYIIYIILLIFVIYIIAF
tara:strand:- start:414 stop:626 length:213 start_codon:yes stop_codon:yes gene_type:complete